MKWSTLHSYLNDFVEYVISMNNESKKNLKECELHNNFLGISYHDGRYDATKEILDIMNDYFEMILEELHNDERSNR